ncbi:IclR family transcriptional regulator [Halorarum salinum]|uniref:IclR family transcriptional regulator n=1 Tax=Halorarum salinum TaxID=2743089 RepID=A0A7D5Q9M1_9EURY|nr:IclR family transcriptional regulator [Halobaculum salinum]QLG61058.1 IclR family transcriptional regulator [Halobaculum salinum]
MVKTLEKTVEIIDGLDANGPCTPSALAARTGLPRSTVYHHLSTLAENGFVVNTDGTYRLALRFLSIGETVRRGMELFDIARTEIDELASRIDLPVGLYVSEYDQAVLLYDRGENPSVPATVHVGDHLPLHTTAAGKALLSIQAEREADGVGDEARRSYTDRTITDPSTLESSLSGIADRGYATACGERWNGRCSLAVALAYGDESDAAAIEIELSPEQFDDLDHGELASEVQRTASVIEIKSDYSP